MKFLKRFLAKKEAPSNLDVFNVDTFNDWFCDPNNNAVYANKGIFLRVDKLSISQIEDYLEKRWSIMDKSYDSMSKFQDQIKKDWAHKSWLAAKD